jgi:hypothetical protein
MVALIISMGLFIGGGAANAGPDMSEKNRITRTIQEAALDVLIPFSHQDISER